MVGVGADWEEGLQAITAFNLGSPKAETGLFKNDVCIVLAAILCSGATYWSLMVVDYPWTWIKILAIPLLHFCLFVMLAIPLWNERQIGRPYHYCKFRAVEFLMGTEPGYEYSKREIGRTHRLVRLLISLIYVDARSSRFLQVISNGGDVLHFQSAHSFMGTLPMKIVALIISGLSAVAYLCQYVILKSASTERSAIWVGIQGLMALIRILYWMSDPKFDDPATELAEYALINNTSFKSITNFELVCAVLPNKMTPVRVPGWALKYVLETPLRDILTAVTSEGHPHVPTNAQTYIFENVCFERILRNRLGNVEPAGQTGWKFGVWREPSKKGITPFLLVNVLYDEIVHNDRLSHWGWMQTAGADGFMNNADSPETCSIVRPETIFLLHKGRRATLTGYSDSWALKSLGTFQEHPHSWGYLRERSQRLHDRLKDLLNRKEVDPNQKNARTEPQALHHRAVNTFAHRLWISATNGTVDRMYGRARAAGQFLMPREPGQMSLKQSLDMLRDYIEEPSNGHVVGDRPSKSATEKRPAHTISSV